MTAQRRGAKPLAAFMPEILSEALAARGMSEMSIVAEWPAIVGEGIATYARPIQMQWPPRANNRDPDASASGATLVLRVESAFALEAQHNAAIVIARINAHLGWRCVERIAFRQGPLPPIKGSRSAPPAPSEEAKTEAREAARMIEDEGLREAVTRLGARAIDQSARVTRGG
jgi:hypothetical protein